MVQTLEAIRGGGGSVRVGTTGKISALMSREISSTKSTSKPPSLYTSVGVLRPKPKPSPDETSSTIVKNDKCPEAINKTKHYPKRTQQIPMLEADNISIDGTPIRTKPVKHGRNIVEIVDLKCGNHVTGRLKKLGFSKLSDSTV